ncbi:MAG: hypothetical protein AAFX87_31410, partial [Bacteroidota bacterium]
MTRKLILLIVTVLVFNECKKKETLFKINLTEYELYELKFDFEHIDLVRTYGIHKCTLVNNCCLPFFSAFV